ncbi:MAG: DUF3343 domain-containing protein [Thermoanaerobacteraceae bacterium]
MKFGLIVFYSYQHGVMVEKILKRNNIPVEFVPTPRSFMYSCSNSIRFGLEYKNLVKDILKRINIPYKGIYEVEKNYNGYKVVNNI